MKLRALTLQDTPLMLEWMHDASVVENLNANFAAKTLEDCHNFIRSCEDTTENLHLAIADENDEYMGTVSLKHIRQAEKDAEFAITIRACAMGKGISSYGMDSILRMGLQQLGLDRIYWCVSPDNRRAVRFYDKNNYPRVDVATLQPIGYTKQQLDYYIWYAVTASDMIQ